MGASREVLLSAAYWGLFQLENDATQDDGCWAIQLVVSLPRVAETADAADVELLMMAGGALPEVRM